MQWRGGTHDYTFEKELRKLGQEQCNEAKAQKIWQAIIMLYFETK